MGAVGDKDIRLAEGSLVEKQVQPLASGQATALMLGLDPSFTAPQAGLFAELLEVLKLGFVAPLPFS